MDLLEFPNPAVFDADLPASQPEDGPGGIDADKIGPAEAPAARVQDQTQIEDVSEGPKDINRGSDESTRTASSRRAKKIQAMRDDFYAAELRTFGAMATAKKRRLPRGEALLKQ